MLSTNLMSELKQIFNFVIQLKWFISGVIALLLFIITKFFLFDIVKVNANDMQCTFNYADVLFVKKFANKYKVNDCVYIKYPVKDSNISTTYFVQRIVALPGDSLEIKNKLLFVNGIEIKDTSTIKHNYYLKTDKYTIDSMFKMRYQLSQGGAISNEFDYNFSLTKTQADSLTENKYIKKIELKSLNKNNFDINCFPFSLQYTWNKDNYGKLYIPKKNDTLTLDSLNIDLYKTIIEQYENNTLIINNDSIFINNLFTKQYIVKQNYYFVMADNRDNANDSRMWGFLPQNYIIGKVIGIIKKAKK